MVTSGQFLSPSPQCHPLICTVAGRTWQRENICIFPEHITFTSSNFSLTNWIQAEKELNNSLFPSRQQLANCRKDESGARCWPGNKFALEQRDFQPLCSTLSMQQNGAGIKVRRTFLAFCSEKIKGGVDRDLRYPRAFYYKSQDLQIST